MKLLNYFDEYELSELFDKMMLAPLTNSKGYHVINYSNGDRLKAELATVGNKIYVNVILGAVYFLWYNGKNMFNKDEFIDMFKKGYLIKTEGEIVL